MLDVREHDSLVNDSARAAALAVMSDTTALAIHAVLDGRSEVLGRRTMTAVTQLVQSLTTLREQPMIEPGSHADVFKSEDITSGVGRLIGEEAPGRPGIAGWSDLLEFSKAIAIDSAGSLVINDADKARRLADMLKDLGAAANHQSAFTFARSRNSSSE